jgi:hypothetical protein
MDGGPRRTWKCAVRAEEMNLRTHRSLKEATKQKKDTVMEMKHNILSKISLISALAIVQAFASGCATNTGTSDQMQPMKGGEHQQMINK